MDGDAERGVARQHDFGVKHQELADMIEGRDTAWLASIGGMDGLLDDLHTSPAGLSREELAEDGGSLSARAEAFGTNRLVYPDPKSFFSLLLAAFKDLTIIILCVAAVVSLVLGVALSDKREEFGYLEGIAIVLVVLVVVVVQASIDYSKERKFRELNSVKDNYEVTVRRGGETVSIPADTLLVGDILKVAAGDKLAADGLLIESSKIKTNESAMTGEPIDIGKDVWMGPDDEESDPFLLSGTTISEGVGHLVVVATGTHSQWGIILSKLIEEPVDTPLQKRLDRLAWNIGKIGIIMATLTFAVSMLRWIVESAQDGAWDGTQVLKFFIDSVTIVVVAIPEGLPLAITLGLAFAQKKMMQDMNLVRRLEACETMGSATQLNADKTGTLTANRMTVVESYLGGVKLLHQAEGLAARDPSVPDKSAAVAEAATGEPAEVGAVFSSTDVVGAGTESGLSRTFREAFAVNVAVNSQANLQVKANGLVEHLGSKTECALLQLIESWGYSYAAVRVAAPPTRIWLFDSTRKRMSSTSAVPGRPGVQRLHTKGAPEMLAPLLSYQMGLDGRVAPFTAADRAALVLNVDRLAERGLRTLLLAYRDVDVPLDDKVFWDTAPETNMTLLGVVGIKDPIRPETLEAVRLLKGAGVNVRMVTGDNVLTASFIAREAGILDEGGVVLDGPSFRKMSQEELDAVAIKIQVLARSTPTDKLALVKQHKRMGEVVAVTGDGTNDAPALKEADVGFALGLAGTEVAKEACDIVILDDNIQSMAKAVLWGRSVFWSIRKFLQFQLVVNVVAVSLNFISACAGEELPLGPVPLLWVNMIMDSMGALALATEPPRPDLMKQKPFGRFAPLINRGMYRNIIFLSIYQLVVCLVLQFAGGSIFDITCAENDDDCHKIIPSIIFNTFVFMQIFSEINARRITEKNVFAGIFHSYYFGTIIIITTIIQVLLMLLVGRTSVGRAIRIVTIPGSGWIASIVLGALILPIGFIARLWPLSWSIGPEDGDPLAMSKLEKLFHFPVRRRKGMDLLAAEQEERDRDNAEVGPFVSPATGPLDATPAELAATDGDLEKINSLRARTQPVGGDPEAARLRLRVFVHAIAFVNVVQRGGLPPGSSPVKGVDSSDDTPSV